MAESDNLFQKAFYLGVGMASYAVEKANDTLQDLRQQAEKLAKLDDFPQQIQKMADEMVNKGKMSAEEARNFVEDMMRHNQEGKTQKNQDSAQKPRPIEIIDEDN